MRRFCSFSHWGLWDVTPWPFCVPYQITELVETWHDHSQEPYDGTE